MSVVAWDGKTLAADKMSLSNDFKREASKIFRLNSTNHNSIVAFIGNLASGLAMVEWYKAGARNIEWPSSQSTPESAWLVVIEPGGHCYEFNHVPVPIHITGPFMAWGSGRDFAMGALSMGATAEKAVEIANQWSCSCGFGVEAYKLER